MDPVVLFSTAAAGTVAAAVVATWVEYPLAKSAIRSPCDQLVSAEGSDTESRQPLKTDLTRFFLSSVFVNFRQEKKLLWEHLFLQDGKERRRAKAYGENTSKLAIHSKVRGSETDRRPYCSNIPMKIPKHCVELKRNASESLDADQFPKRRTH